MVSNAEITRLLNDAIGHRARLAADGHAEPAKLIEDMAEAIYYLRDKLRECREDGKARKRKG